LSGYPPCDPSDPCRLSKILDYQYNQPVYYARWTSLCPLECDKINYGTRISSQNYPSREQFELFQNNATLVDHYTNDLKLDVSTYTEYKKYFYKLNIFYDSNEYTYVTLSPAVTVVSLLSNLGGSLGALLGFTLYTFLEGLEILFHIFHILFFHK